MRYTGQYPKSTKKGGRIVQNRKKVDKKKKRKSNQNYHREIGKETTQIHIHHELRAKSVRNPWTSDYWLLAPDPFRCRLLTDTISTWQTNSILPPPQIHNYNMEEYGGIWRNTEDHCVSLAVYENIFKMKNGFL